MRHVHAFGDDALGDLDAVGLGEAIRAGGSPGRGRRGGHRPHRGRQPALNGLAYKAFERARAEAAKPQPAGGFFAACRRSSRTTSTSPACRRCGAPTHGRRDRPRRRRVRPAVPGHRADTAGQDADVGIRVQRLGRTSAAGAGPQPVEHRLHRRRVVVGIGRVRRRRRGADRTRQRRRRLDPNSGRPATGLSGSSRRAAGCRWTRKLRRMPVGIVTNGVLTRSVRDTAAFYREAERIWRHRKLPPIGDVTGPGRQRLRIAVRHPFGPARVQPRSAGADAEDRRLARRTGPPRRTPRTAAGARPASSTTSCCTGGCWRGAGAQPGGACSAIPSTAPGSTT